MTVSTEVPPLAALMAADRDAIDALLLFIGNQTPIERHKHNVDSYDLQQCLLRLTPDAAQKLLAQLSAKIEALETLAPRQLAAISITEQVLQAFFAQPIFRPELRALLQQFSAKIAANTLDRNGWLYSTQHPLRELLNQLGDFFAGWFAELGRSADASAQQIQNALLSVELDWQPTLQQINESVSRDAARTQKLEQRLIDSETGAMKARRARQLATKTINGLINGKQIPRSAIDFFHGPWLQSLQLALIQQGDRSELWFRQRKLTETVIWSVQPIKDEVQRQQLFRVVGQIGDELRDTLISLAHNVEAKDDALKAIEQVHLQLIQNAAVDYMEAPLINQDDTLLDSNTTISRSLLAKVDALSVGDWFDFPHQAEQRRLKLLIKQDDSQQLLFVNQLGVKILVQSFEEFAYQLASGGAIVLNTTQLFDTCWHNTLNELHTKMINAAVHAERIATDARIKNEIEQRTREAARLKAEAEAAALNAAKEQAEAERRDAALLAEQQHRLDAIAAQGADEAARLQRARLIASSLTIGAWLEWRNELGDVEKLKLAVMLPTSGKSILVDRNGIKKHEVLRDQLIQQLVDGTLTLINSGQQFEDSLARVVGGLRRDRN
jgi:hypothetical protein